MMILVTGGAGFIGSNFVIHAVNSGRHNIVNLDKLTYAGNLETLKSISGHENYLFVYGDIGDKKLVSSLLEKHHPYAIINFAAESHVDRSIYDPHDFVQTNIVGTFNLLESVREYYQSLDAYQKIQFRFLHVSTDEVYGSLEKNDPPFSESNPYEPNSPYAATKAASDHLVRAWHHTYGIPVLTTNCSNNYGPYQFPEKLIPLIIRNALHHKPLPIYGDGLQVRDWLYVEDHCAAIETVLLKGKIGETYNIGGNNEKTNLFVIETICQILNKLMPRQDQKSYTELIRFVKDRLGHDRRYEINEKKISSELGWAPKETFESGIEKTIQWYLSNSSWVESILSGSYREWVAKQYGH